MKNASFRSQPQPRREGGRGVVDLENLPPSVAARGVLGCGKKEAFSRPAGLEREGAERGMIGVKSSRER